MNDSSPRYRVILGAVSLILGPALMSLGDLFHPAEDWSAAAQVAIVAQATTRWYGAHLFLLIGLLVFVPGILAMTELVARHKPARGYLARVLLIVSVGALSAVFVSEMLLGRFIAAGADQATATTLFETFQSGAVFGALMLPLLAFFVGTGVAVVTLASAPGPLRGPALILGLGAILILGEIVLAKVLLSQIGNLLNLVAGIGFSRELLRAQVRT